MGKDNATSDFKHRKQKVGKKKLAPLNETRIDVKFARLESIRTNVHEDEDDEENENLPQSSSSSTTDHPRRKKTASLSTLKETLKHTQNHNTTMRKDALIALGNILKNDPSLLTIHSSFIFQILAERILDTESIIRTHLITLLNWILRNFPPAVEATVPHLPIVVLYLSNALSKLATDIRLDGLGILNTLLATIVHSSSSSSSSSSILSLFRSQLLVPTAELLEPQLYSMIVNSLLGSSLPSIYGIGQSAATTISSTSTSYSSSKNTSSISTGITRKKLTSIEARICCTYVLRRMLLNGKDYAVGDALFSSSLSSSSSSSKNTSVPLPNKPLLQFDSDYTLPSSITVNDDKNSSSFSPVAPLIYGYFTRSLPNPTNVTALSSFMDSFSILFNPHNYNRTQIDTASSSSPSLPPPLAFRSIAYLFQLWLECGPSEVHALAVSGITRLSLIIHTLRLIIQSLRHISCANEYHSTLNGLNSLLVFSPRIVYHEIPDAAILKSLIEIGKTGTIDLEHALQGKNNNAASSSPASSLLSIGYRLVIRAIQLYVLPSFPFVSSRIASSLSSSSSSSSSTTVVSHEDIAIGILNVRILELLCTIFPDKEGLTIARHQIQASKPYLSATKRTSESDKSDGKETQNPFSVLTPIVTKPEPVKPLNNKRERTNESDTIPPQREETEKRQNGTKKNKVSRPQPETSATSATPEETVTETLVPLSNNEHYQAWRKYLNETQNIQRALKNYQSMFQKVFTFTRDQLHQIKDNTNRNTDIHTASNVAITLLPCILPLLLPILGQLEHNPSDIQELLQLFDTVYSTSSAKSIMKARCVDFITTVFQHDHQDSTFTLPSAFIHGWIHSFPRLLWSLGTTDIPTTKRCLGWLRTFSLRSVSMSPLHMILKDVLRQLTPLFYAVRTNHDANSVGTFGPFLEYPDDVQQLCLDCVANINTVSSPLRRGLLVLCRHPQISPAIRTKIVETLILATIGMDNVLPGTGRLTNDGFDNNNNAMNAVYTMNDTSLTIPRPNTLPEACADALATLLSLVLGRNIERSVYLSGPLLTISVFNKGDRGDAVDTIVSETNEGLGMDIFRIQELCQGDANVYYEITETYGRYLGMMMGTYWRYRSTIIGTVHSVIDSCLKDGLTGTNNVDQENNATTLRSSDTRGTDNGFRSFSLYRLSRTWDTLTNRLLRTTYEVCPPLVSSFEEKLLAATYLQDYQRQYSKDGAVDRNSFSLDTNDVALGIWFHDNYEYFSTWETGSATVKEDDTNYARTEIHERLSSLLSMLTILVQNHTGRKGTYSYTVGLDTLLTVLEKVQDRLLAQTKEDLTKKTSTNSNPEESQRNIWTPSLLDKLFSVIIMGKRLRTA